MKRLFFFLPSILLGVLFMSCSKDDNGPSGEAFLRCKLNGQLKEFNHTPTASGHLAGDPTNGLYISASDSDDFMNAAFFKIYLIINEDITEGTYHVAGESYPELDGQYCIGTTGECYDGGRDSDTYFTLTITSIGSSSMKGTFSGLLDQIAGDGLIEVTDGEFSVPLN